MARARLALLLPLALLVPAACSDDDGGSDAASASGSGSVAEEQTTTTEEDDAPSTTAGPSTTSSSVAGAPTSTTTPDGPGIELVGAKGSGTFAFDVFPERSELCYRMEVEGIGTQTAARIERGDGSGVLNLIAPESGDSINTCVASDALTLEEIAASPAGFSVVVIGSSGRLAALLG